MTFRLSNLLSKLSFVAIAVAFSFSGVGSRAEPVQAVPSLGTVKVRTFLTTGDRSHLLAQEPDHQLAPEAAKAASATVSAPTLPTIEVDPSQRFQTMAGFGASITESSAWLLQHSMNAAQRESLLNELFGRGRSGLGFDFTRVAIGSSDFSVTKHYSFDDMPKGQTDPELKHFSIESQRAELLPVLKRAMAINPQLKVMATPWSAPGWMKTNDSLIQGALRNDKQAVFAAYLVRYIDAMAAEGVPIFALSVQNEPLFEPKDYPGMFLPAPARAALVGQHLGPLLESQGYTTQIIDWDHNWDKPHEPLAMLDDPQARRYITGVGWHCYAGKPAAQLVVHDAHPDKDVWFTECSGGEWTPKWADALRFTVRDLIISSTRNWARGVLMWNLALDEKHGPRLGGCTNCRGVVTVNSRTGEVTRNVEYYAFGHASRFVRSGAQRIESSAKSDGLESVAFRNADDGSIVLIVVNMNASDKPFTIRSGGRSMAAHLPRESVATYVWKQ